MLNSEEITRINNKIQNGDKLTRKENITFRGEYNTRKADLKFAFDYKELQEYNKCYSNHAYFIDEYCLKLREYQKEWIDEFSQNKFRIHLCSHEMGFYRVYAAKYLAQLMYGYNRTILVIGDKSDTCNEFIEIMWNLYKDLPFYLKAGVRNKNKKQIIFDNGSRIKTSFSKDAGIGFGFNVLQYINFSDFKHAQKTFTNLIPIISTSFDCQVNIMSSASKNNFFEKLVKYSELKDGHPKKNAFKTIKTYWWELEGRDDKWMKEKIEEYGEKYFKRNYEIEF